MAHRSVLPLIRHARAGDATSQFELGKLYLDGGQGLAANQGSALLWLGKSADQGYAEAWRLIGQRISPEVADTVPNLIRWYEMAANDGCMAAQTKLAQLLLSGPQAGDGANPADAAIQLLRGAAAGGEATARIELGVRLLRDPPNGASKADEAIAYLEQAYAAGKSEAARHLAEHYWRVGDAEPAHLWYSRCMDPQDVELCYRFGMLGALLGEPGGKLLERAAAAGHRLACEELGLGYAIGYRRESGRRPGSRNFKKAARWLERAASLGSGKACFFLALLYEHQNCSFRSHGKAREWLFEAARRGHAEAQYRAGASLLRDLAGGRAPDPQETGHDEPDVAAVRLLIEAERQGHVQAARALDAAACRAPRLDESRAARWSNAIAAMMPLSVPVAMRLELAWAFGLRICEMILIDPVEAHRGDCLVIDLRDSGIKLRRRVVAIEHPAQREAADRARSLFRVSSPLPGDLQGGYDSRHGRLSRLCVQAGVDLRQLRKRAAETTFPSRLHGEPAGRGIKPVPSSSRLAG